MTTGGLQINMKTVFETAISMWTRSRRIEMLRWIVMSGEKAFFFAP
jgi:hypothetical protein